MNTAIENLDLARLSQVDRLELAQVLLDSIFVENEPEPFTPEQMEELDRRLADIDGGRLVCEPWDVVHDRLLAKCR